MSGLKILKENWDDYNKRKVRENEDPLSFMCKEKWEVDFLIVKIRGAYSHLPEESIINAIKACCKNIEGSRPRKDFVNCVMIRLRGL